MPGMIPEGSPEEARNIDAFASFIYCARRATSALSVELDRRGIGPDEVNEWMLLRLLQTDGGTQINKLAFDLAMDKKDILRITERMMNDGLIGFSDGEDTPRYRRTIAITDAGQTKLASHEGTISEVADDAASVMPAGRMVSFARAVMSLTRGLKRIQKDKVD